jgi:hypothetical protein
MKLLKPLFLTVLFLSILPGFSNRAVLAQGGPPLITDDPATPGDGNWEINVAFEVEKRRTQRSYAIPLLDINYGLGDRLQLKYEVPWLVLDERGGHTGAGLGNSALGVKWRFFDQDRQRIDMSVYPQLEFNSSDSAVDRGLVDRGMEFVLPLQVEKSFGLISLNPEFGYVFHEYGDNEWMYGLALGYEASGELELLGEISGTTGQDFDNDELVFNIGARWELNETNTFLISAGRSFHDSASDEPEFLLYTGMQFNF